MTTPDVARAVTVDEFEQFLALPENENRRFELIDGEIVEKVPTREQAIIGATITGELYIYLLANPVGQLGVEARHRPTDSKHNDRLPDVSVVLGQKPVERVGPANYIPDVAVEVQSPDDTVSQMLKKAVFYIEHSCKWVLLVFTRKRRVGVMTPDDYTEYGEGEIIEGGDVLPGFMLPVATIFRGV